MNGNGKALCSTLLLLALAAPPALAADPPGLLNYQGVLRDASDAPLDGGYDMTFRFFSAETGGDEILIDRHRAAYGTGPVTVTNGLFNVSLGGGALADGSGPGTYGSLRDVFRDYSEVWLEVTVGTEGLDPRVRIVASAYALNSAYLGGRSSSEFLDTSSSPQTKNGKLTVTSSVLTEYAIEGSSPQGGGHFLHSDGSGYAYVGVEDIGIRGYGSSMGGFFGDLDSSGYAYVGFGDWGIQGVGTYAGGYFVDLDSSGRAHVGFGDYGIQGQGNIAGGTFQDGNESGYAEVGFGHYGIRGFGNLAGAFFLDGNESGYAEVGVGDEGIRGFGNFAGGYFEDLDHSGYAYVGSGDTGVIGYGNSLGGYFSDSNGSGYAYVGNNDTGVMGYGDTSGGYFRDSNSSGFAHVGYGDYGIEAFGNDTGGYFADVDSSGVGRGGYGDLGIAGWGNEAGGFFKDKDNSGYGYVGYGDRGIWAKGTFAGGTFSHPDNTTFWADVSTPTHKIYGTGSVSFVQNHPHDPGKVIVYTAPEGDEVATYTRGTARLVNGEARVALGETFAWVTHPDVGLTAYVTARDQAVPLAVVSLTTDELVVVGPADGPLDILFDYIVFGLRIGFEEASVVQAKQKEAPLPSPAVFDESYAAQPGLRAFNALERFKEMLAEVTGTPSNRLDLGGAQALRQAIDAAGQRELGKVDPEISRLAQRPPDGTGENVSQSTASALEPTAATAPGPSLGVSTETTSDPPAGVVGADDPEPSSLFTLLPVSGTVEIGDVLTLDPDGSGRLRRAELAADPAVVGIVAGEALTVEGEPHAPVALYGLAEIKADAEYRAILAGDLLTTSPTPGHAMSAVAAAPGTVIGKAMESLQSGTGTIRVLVMPR